MADNVKHVTDADFNETLASTDKPVLIDFWAPWCGPCQMLGPIIGEIADESVDTSVVGKINIDENPDTASKFGVMSIPTVLVFKNGEVKETFVGVQSKDTYVDALKNNA